MASQKSDFAQLWNNQVKCDPSNETEMKELKIKFSPINNISSADRNFNYQNINITAINPKTLKEGSLIVKGLAWRTQGVKQIKQQAGKYSISFYALEKNEDGSCKDEISKIWCSNLLKYISKPIVDYVLSLKPTSNLDKRQGLLPKSFSAIRDGTIARKLAILSKDSKSEVEENPDDTDVESFLMQDGIKTLFLSTKLYERNQKKGDNKTKVIGTTFIDVNNINNKISYLHLDSQCIIAPEFRIESIYIGADKISVQLKILSGQVFFTNIGGDSNVSIYVPANLSSIKERYGKPQNDENDEVNEPVHVDVSQNKLGNSILDEEDEISTKVEVPRKKIVKRKVEEVNDDEEDT